MKMEYIRTTHIFSGFENYMDFKKVDSYAEEMITQDKWNGGIDFPPILGYYTKYEGYSINGESIFNSLDNGLERIIYKKGEIIFVVTDGHHRSFAAVKAGIYSLQTECANLNNFDLFISICFCLQCKGR